MKTSELKKALNASRAISKVHSVYIQDRKAKDGTRFTRVVLTYGHLLEVVTLTFMDGKVFEIEGTINMPNLRDYSKEIERYIAQS